MTRVLVRDPHREVAKGLVADDRLHVLAHVANARRQPGGSGGPVRPVLKQMRVALEMRAATGGIHEDDVGSLESGDVELREPHRLGLVAGVRVERTTAGLSRSVDDLGAEVREHARGRGVHVAIGRAHDAAQK